MKKLLLVAVLGALATSGCATKKYVHDHVEGQVGPVKQELQALDARTAASLRGLAATDAELRAGLTAQGERLGRNEAELARLSKSAQDALARAVAAGRLAEGKLMYEVVMKEDVLRFATDSAVLDARARAALDAFAARLKAENRNVFIEIQGHTDSRGDAAANERLGLARAEAVRRHLYMQAGFPLHRMAVISYGETAPVASNATRAGRSENRRVVLVVLH